MDKFTCDNCKKELLTCMHDNIISRVKNSKICVCCGDEIRKKTFTEYSNRHVKNNVQVLDDESIEKEVNQIKQLIQLYENKLSILKKSCNHNKYRNVNGTKTCNNCNEKLGDWCEVSPDNIHYYNFDEDSNDRVCIYCGEYWD
jgi:hypothetical protein